MEKHLKILLLEDSESDAGLIQHELKKSGLNFITTIVETKKDFENALQNFNPDVILSDHSLPRFNSLDALNLYKEYKCTCPFILVTGSVSEEFAVKSIKEGADDYILKNNLIRLIPAINNALQTRSIRAEKEKVVQQLIYTNKELNTFIYKASHDLRGPISSIMGLANIASTQEKEKLPGYIEMISESAHKLNATLVSLIDVMLIRDENPSIKKIDLKNILNNILKKLEPSKNFTKINFQIEINCKHILFSDEKILNSVLFNIIDNAIKYQNTSIYDSFIKIIFSDLNAGIKIEITDNGVGIDPEIQSKIFEVFYKGNLGSKGSGLGLYIVKNGVEKLGGNIEVKSEKRKETTFTITLPILKVTS